MATAMGRLPDVMVMHLDPAGFPNGWGTPTVLWRLPLIAGMSLLMNLVVAWFVIGAAFPIRGAQDAVPMVVAGELVVDSPEVVYVDGETGGIFDPQPEFRERACEVMGSSLEVASSRITISGSFRKTRMKV